ncbi:MAG TPA: bifunctional phosphopantothenoylcysteine decarboxylase/phosphopantothenate--cysteine ligase CoaBC [Longimicrobiales bacterium]|nr:bifunctional phosphopantothenoylcysteine decarboxylase/phosphopantothenate--cysteine ligase CoaBC [Longimicrobiales bacterium]
MRPWSGRNVLLGVAGGIAAYKSVQIARDLTQLGALVDVVLTHSAREFVGPVTFEALTGRPVHTDLIAEGKALDHIRLARGADVVCVAPATADLLARAAAGRSDDLLTAILLATTSPVILCPAMNDAMWAHPQTRLNAKHVSEVLGYRMVGPAVGPLAEGDTDQPGRMEEPPTIIAHISRALEKDSALCGKRVVVTAGPTREAVDPVRVLSNRSSGRMGYALASAAWRRGADVVLISGPASIPVPVGPRLVAIETSEEMASAVRGAIGDADVLVMAAAVADFRPAMPAQSKIKKSSGVSAIELEHAPDVLKVTRDARNPRLKVVGFALETDAHEANAKKKLEEKGMDLIVLNDATEPGAGFEVATNKVTIYSRAGEKLEIPLMSKDEVADAILDSLVRIL